jgi:uncharacterized protein YdiU (UPF0061 family)
MSLSPDFRPAAVLADLGSEFWDEVSSARFPKTIIRYRNDRVAQGLGLGSLSDEAWIAHFGRFEPLPGSLQRPLAMRYHGHQFRSYNPDLGDGRGFVFAQMQELESDRLVDLSTKGSGQTPYSRSGDGRLTLKGGVREVLATALLEALGVPTSDSLSLIETGEDLQRNDEPSPTRSAVLVRRTHASIRFGTFQRHAYHQRPDLVGQLVDHVLETYHPDLLSAPNRAAALLDMAVERSARMAAGWMSAGFVHGVLNTDNMNINGESFDYGPYRFLPFNDPNHVAAYFDQTGLYAFGRQPEAVLWNLQQLAGCLTLVSDDAPLAEALERFAGHYRQALTSAMVRRLGLEATDAQADIPLVNAAFRALAEGAPGLRWEPFFFDWYGGLESEGRAMSGPRAELYSGPAFEVLREQLAGRKARVGVDLTQAFFQAEEPEELLYAEIEEIWAAIAQSDDWSLFQNKLERIEAARKAWGLTLSART